MGGDHRRADRWRQAEQILAAVNGKWSATILRHLGDGKEAGRRPTVLLAGINDELAGARGGANGPLSRKVLLDCLDRLREQGLVRREEIQHQPPRETVYRLTADGWHILRALRQMAGIPSWWESVVHDAGSPVPADIDTTTPHIARVYDYFLGGKDNFAVDRAAGDEFAELMPAVVTTIRQGRPVLGRVVRFLVTDCGIRQFLDIGAGLPTAANTHQVAQRAAPECRVVYVDNDPMVLAHARALLTSCPEGRTAYIHADLRDTGRILAEAARTLDFDEPVAVMLSGILHCIPDDEDPWRIVADLVDAVTPGSYFLIAHPASDIVTGAPAATAKINSRLSEPITFRARDQIARFLAGLEIVEPGLVQPQQWRPDQDTPQPDHPLAVWCAVGRKP